jgi:hypothetical protein
MKIIAILPTGRNIGEKELRIRIMSPARQKDRGFSAGTGLTTIPGPREIPLTTGLILAEVITEP